MNLFEYLPREIFGVFIRSMDFKQAAGCRSVARFWRDTIPREIEVSPNLEMHIRASETRLLSWSNIRKINLTANSSIRGGLLKSFTNLTFLNLSYDALIDDSCLMNFTRLISLKVQGCTRVFSSSVLVHTNLTALSLNLNSSMAPVLNSISNFPHLRVLDLRGHNARPPHIEALSQLPSLQWLELQYCIPQHEHKAVEQRIELFPVLTKLTTLTGLSLYKVEERNYYPPDEREKKRKTTFVVDLLLSSLKHLVHFRPGRTVFDPVGLTNLKSLTSLDLYPSALKDNETPIIPKDLIFIPIKTLRIPENWKTELLVLPSLESLILGRSTVSFNFMQHPNLHTVCWRFGDRDSYAYKEPPPPFKSEPGVTYYNMTKPPEERDHPLIASYFYGNYEWPRVFL